MDDRIFLTQKIMPGHLVELDRRGPYDHFFGGSHDLRGGECPNCLKPLMLHLTLDTSDPRLNLASCGVDRLRLLFCMRCDIQEEDFVYRMIDDHEIEIIDYCQGDEFTEEYQRYWYDECGFSDTFSKRPITLTPMPARLQELIDLIIQRGGGFTVTPDERRELEELAGITPAPNHPHAHGFNQVGGFGYLWNAEAIPHKCMACERLGLNSRTGFVAVLVNSAPPLGVTSLGPYPLHRDFAIADNRVQIAFGICTYCDAVHAIAAV